VSNIEISAEDRERLAKSKFQEWANEWHGEAKEARKAEFLEWLEEVRKGPQSSQPSQPSQPPPQQQQERPRRTNLLQECLNSTFGF